MRVKHILITLIIILGWCIFFNYNSVQADGMPVTVQLQLPAQNKSDGVVNLDVQPRQQVEIAVLLHNPGNTAVKIRLTAGVAKTNSGGAIFLNDSGSRQMDSSWRYHLRDLGFHNQTVTVNPKSNLKIPIKLQMPDYNGSIAGSIIVTPVQKNANNHNFVSQAQQAYEVLLNVGTYDQLSNRINLGKVQVQSQGGHSVAIGQIHNKQPIYYGSGAVDYRGQIVTDRQRPVANVHLPKATLASNVIMPLTISFGDYPIKAGNYIFKAQVTVAGHTWKFQRKFTITAQEAVQLNKHNLYLKHDYRPLIIILLLIAIIAFSLFLWFVFWYAKNKGVSTKVNKN